MESNNRHLSEELPEFFNIWESGYASFDGRVRGIQAQDVDYLSILHTNQHDLSLENPQTLSKGYSSPIIHDHEHEHEHEEQQKIKTFSPFMDWNTVVSKVKESIASSKCYSSFWNDSSSTFEAPTTPCPLIPFNLMKTNFTISLTEPKEKEGELAIQLLKKINSILKSTFSEFDFSFDPIEWLWKGKFINTNSYCLLDLRVYCQKSINPNIKNLNINNCLCCSSVIQNNNSSCTCFTTSCNNEDIFAFDESEFPPLPSPSITSDEISQNYFVVEANKISGDSKPFSKFFVVLKEQLTTCACVDPCLDILNCSHRNLELNQQEQLEFDEPPSLISSCCCSKKYSVSNSFPTTQSTPESFLDLSMPIFKMSFSDYVDCRLEATKMLCDISKTDNKSLITSSEFIEKVMDSINFLILNHTDNSITNLPPAERLSTTSSYSTSEISSSPFSSFLVSHLNNTPASNCPLLSTLIPPQPTSTTPTSTAFSPCFLTNSNSLNSFETNELYQLCLVKEMSLFALSEFSKLSEYHMSIINSKILPILMDISVYSPQSSLSYSIAQVSRECSAILERISLSSPGDFVQVLLKTHDYPLPLWCIQSGLIKDPKRSSSLNQIYERITPYLNNSVPL